MDRLLNMDEKEKGKEGEEGERGKMSEKEKGDELVFNLMHGKLKYKNERRKEKSHVC